MKSHDIFLLLKLVSLNQQEKSSRQEFASRYTTRGIESETGIGKTLVSQSINRCIQVGLAKLDRTTGLPRVNVKALTDFIVYGLKYVFPAKVTVVSRGIPTSFAAPVLRCKIMSAGELIYIWPDASGSDMGQSVIPLYKTVPMAVKIDPNLYDYLALVDSIRLGNAREVAVATDELDRILKIV